MRTTPNTMAIMYTAMGVLFTYLAIRSAQETIWNVTTVLLMIIATFDFTSAIRFFAFSRFIRKKNQS